MGRGRILVGASVVALLVAAVATFAMTTRDNNMADPNKLGPDGFPIIFWTVASRDKDGVTALLKAGANIDERGFAQETPVLQAATAQSWEMVDFLIQAGADVRLIDKRGFNLPFLAATSQTLEESENGKFLYQKVRPHLAELGLMEKTFHPNTVVQLRDAGSWPPPEWE
ncbi:MAG: hypothetical protein AAFP28_05750 [Pseudomonadota bacterium]